MKVARFIPLILSLGMLGAVALPHAQAANEHAAEWSFVSIDGVEYYSLTNLCRFYKLSEVGKSKNSPHLFYANSAFKLGLVPDSSEILLGGYRCMLMHPVRKDASGELCISKTDLVKLIDPILRPTYITERVELKTIILDPGHGGTDAGNKLYGVDEADYTLQLARELEAELVKLGYRVVLTRQQDRDLSDAERIQLTREASDAIFISLHLNGGADYTAVETYSAAPTVQGGRLMRANRHDEANAALSFALLTHTLAQTQGRDGGCRRAHHSLLNTAQCPAAMVMTGCPVTSAETMEQYRAKLVAGICAGVQAYADSIRKDAAIKVKKIAPPAPAPKPEAEKPAAPKKTEADTAKKKPTSTSGSKKNTSSSKKTSTSSSKSSSKKSSSSSKKKTSTTKSKSTRKNKR